ncbi:hypothetical protein EVAR_2296_1 [Eumeta japonica]|uniref:Reverse transcriptase domain-containing protein n=1 Tax=Eumeta variegata TaxID=151549 RepID=A0A4C1SGJ8_EUMVA|nr:hypothetical protein EVAR_2296_1 [Eumeta japonica]
MNKRTNVNKKDDEWWNFEVRKVVSEKRKHGWIYCQQRPTTECKKDILKYKLKDAESSRQVCTNYCPISLLSVVGKPYAKIIIKRIENETENKIWDLQAGFRKDLEKAHIRVKKNNLWKTLSMHGTGIIAVKTLQKLQNRNINRASPTHGPRFPLARMHRLRKVAKKSSRALNTSNCFSFARTAARHGSRSFADV